MTTTADIALMAHLMRRAGFGATREELEEKVARGYENVVEDLLHPTDDDRENLPDDLIRRVPRRSVRAPPARLARARTGCTR